MRKIIEETYSSVVCDNPNCDYEVNNLVVETDLISYIDKPCPKCGKNLLTTADYIKHQSFSRAIGFINRWFSWITIFYSKKGYEKRRSVCTYIHDGMIFYSLSNKG